MQRALFVFACVSFLSCTESGGPLIGGEGGPSFDPCGPHPTSGFDPVEAKLAACCSDGEAHCVPADAVPGVVGAQLGMCSTTEGGAGLCMPDNAIRQGANYRPQECVSSVGSAKGVCLSRCIPRVANDPQAALLGQDGCRADELCVPCINPISQQATGACLLLEPRCTDGGTTGDAGAAKCPYEGPPLIDPASLPACAPACGGAHCVPATLVSAAQQSLLASCTAAGGVAGLCAPDALIKTGGNFIPKSCRSVAGAEGRCVSQCLPSVAAQAAQLPVDVCTGGEKCAPCFNPVAADPTAPTGACTIACDSPKEPPLMITCPWTGPPLTDPNTFPACACGKSHCVPAANVPPAQQALLAACPGGFCTPDDFIKTGGKLLPKKCTSIAGAEGRCLSTCLPPVAAQASVLPKDVCADDEKCAPCYNPVAADPTLPTGACSIGCDQPAGPPPNLMCPYTGPPILNPASFPSCNPTCAGAHCLPAAQVPASQQSLLATCTGGFCVPDPMISSAGQGVPPSCTSVAGAEGRCVSTCLPSVKAQANLLPQAGCPANTRCVPCFNPTAANPSAPTGACSIACDKPTKPPLLLKCPWTGPAVVDPQVFPACPSCGGSRCVPAAQVPPSLTSQLSTCSGGYCVPDKMVAGAGYTVPAKCTPFAGAPAEGRCLSPCLPAVAAKAAQLRRDTCSAAELCVPCFDPFSGQSTGACTTACDKPSAPPYKFPSCCYDATCVPSSQVPAAQASKLSQDVCPGGFLCAPNEYLPGHFPYTCNGGLLGFQPGACVSRCVNLGIGGIFGQKNCPGNHACVPCLVAPAGTPGC